MAEQTGKKHVLIVGGGFGGVKTALSLSGDGRFDVTLMSERPDFWYFPSLYRVATGATQKLSRIPLSRLFQGKRVKLVTAEATKLDRANKTLTTADGQTYTYDALVLALGVVTNYFGIAGLEEFSYGIKTIQEVEAFKTHLHKQLLDERKPDLNYVIVGGGATGIELAGQLPSYLKSIMKRHGIRDRRIHIDLVEGSPHLLPRSPRAIGRAIERQLRKQGVKLYLGKRVEGETADALKFSGKQLTSHTVIWTAGQANASFYAQNDFRLTPHHKVEVDEFLRSGRPVDEVFVIGDNADTPYSGLAQTAQYDADFVAANLRREQDGRLKEVYKPKKPIYVTPAGPHWAAVEWGRVHIYGWLGWFLREAADVVAFSDIESPIQAGEQWLQEFVPDHNCPLCGDIA